MQPSDLGKKYNKIAHWWCERHDDSNYGVPQFEQALLYAAGPKKVLDVGCGVGGRFVRLLETDGVDYTGIDVSSEMIKLARVNHPQHQFVHGDICSWQAADRYDFIFAWDSIFHLPLSMQEPVVAKLCDLLTSDGILLYTFGQAEGEHTDQWHGDDFYYSSIGISGNLQVLLNHGMTVLHLELDQFPQNHVYTIAKKM